MDLNPVVKCKICGRPYQFMSMMVGDQSVCGGCRKEQKKAAYRPDTQEEKRRRAAYFG